MDEDNIKSTLKVLIRFNFNQKQFVEAIRFIRQWAYENKIEKYTNFKPAYNLACETFNFSSRLPNELKKESKEFICVTRLKEFLFPLNIRIDEFDSHYSLVAPNGYYWRYNYVHNFNNKMPFRGEIKIIKLSNPKHQSQKIDIAMRYIKKGIINHTTGEIKLFK